MKTLDHLAMDEIWGDLMVKRPEIYWLMKRQAELLLQKGHDYSGTEDSYANLRSSSALGISPWRGVLLRMSDKFSRLCNFSCQGILKVKDESVEDTLLDLANYSLLCLVLFKEGQKEGGGS